MLRVTTFDSFRLHSRNLCGYTVHTLARSRALPSQPVPLSGSSAGAVGARLRGHVLRGLDAPFSAGGGSLWPLRHGYSSLHSFCLILFDSTPGRMICQGASTSFLLVPDVKTSCNLALYTLLQSNKRERYFHCKKADAPPAETAAGRHICFVAMKDTKPMKTEWPIITGSDNARRDSAAPDT